MYRDYFVKSGYLITLLLLLLLYFFSHSFLLNQTKNTTSGNYSSLSSWDISPTALKILTGEFKGIVSDILVLEIGAALGDQIIKGKDGKWHRIIKTYDWQTINRMIKLNQVLDPHFDQTLYLVQGWLPWYGYVDEANQFHKEFAQYNPWDWRPYHFMGFNAYFFENDYAKAGELMLKGGNIPKAPPFLAILGARLSQKGRNVETAIRLLETILTEKKPSDFDYQDIHDRYEALKGVYVIEHAISQYKRLTGKLPENLDELLQSGTLTSLPPNPYKLNYCIDKEGNVYYDNKKCQ